MKRLALTSALVMTACLYNRDGYHKYNIPGTLPGEAHGVGELSVARVTATTVAPDGSGSERDGRLAILRYTGGMLIGVTRFGTAGGIDVSAGAGYLDGDAASVADDRDEKHIYLEGEVGGVMQPLRVTPGPVLLRLSADFGIGFTLDDRYTYAGGRFGIGSASGSFALDVTYRRRFGDVPGNPGAHEDRARALISLRPAQRKRRQYYAGVEWVRGDQRTLDAMGTEVSRDDYLLRGRYDMLVGVFAIGLGRTPD